MTTRSARELTALCGARLHGTAEATVCGISDVDHAGPDHLVFAEGEAELARALQSGASVILTHPPVPDVPPGKALLVCDQPRLVFARLVAAWIGATGPGPGIDPTAVVHPTATVDPTAHIGPGALVGAGARVGARTRVGPRVTLEEGVCVGEDGDLGPNVVVHRRTTIGDRVSVHAGAVLGGPGFGFVRDAQTGEHVRLPQVGTLVIGDDVDIGANVTIDRGTFRETRIGRGTKIDNMVHIAHNVQVGEHVVVIAQVGIAGSAEIGDCVVLAGQAGIADHVRVEAGVQVGAQSGVPSRKVLRGAGRVYWGTPARPIEQVMKELATLSRMSKR